MCPALKHEPRPDIEGSWHKTYIAKRLAKSGFSTKDNENDAATTGGGGFGLIEDGVVGIRGAGWFSST